MTSYLDKGIAAPKEHLTGTGWVNRNVKPAEGYTVYMGTVTFF